MSAAEVCGRPIDMGRPKAQVRVEGALHIRRALGGIEKGLRGPGRRCFSQVISWRTARSQPGSLSLPAQALPPLRHMESPAGCEVEDAVSRALAAAHPLLRKRCSNTVYIFTAIFV